MSKSDYINPEEHIFYCDKSDWYTTNKEGEKDWSNSRSKVEEFWRLVREQKMAKKDHDFSEFIFPVFIKDNFWEGKIEKKFESPENSTVHSFKGAVFEDSAVFGQARFTKEANFQEARFTKEANFQEAQFTKEANFIGARFTEEANFMRAQFTEGANFGQAQFTEGANFIGARFTEGANFGQAQFTEWANFGQAQFTEWANFWKAQFTKEANFIGARFTEWANFIGARFTKEANFYGAQFTEWADFKLAQFTKEADFKLAQFTKEANFGQAQFTKEADFKLAQFTKEANFGQAQFTEGANFKNCTFAGELFFVGFYCVNEAKLNFDSTKFSKEYLSLFKDWKLGDKKNSKQSSPAINIKFQEVIFNDHVEFLDCNFKNVVFEKCDLVEAKFSNCEFPKKKFRTHFANEGFLKPEKNQKIEKKSKRKHYEMIGEVYRQLKTNMIDDKYWQEAGDAYRSEMVIRRKVLKYQWLENPHRMSILFNWLINFFHDRLSAYQQSMARPFLLLLVTWFGFGVFYYLQYAPPDWPISFSAMKISILNSAYYLLAPLGIIRPEAWEGFSQPNLMRALIYSERVIGGILLTFFVLATRARMKQ